MSKKGMKKGTILVEQSNVRSANQLARNRIKVLDRDDNKCVRCGSKHRLQVHHIEPWKPGQDNPHRLDNLETLCQDCHLKEHWESKSETDRFSHVSRMARSRWDHISPEERSRYSKEVMLSAQHSSPRVWWSNGIEERRLRIDEPPPVSWWQGRISSRRDGSNFLGMEILC